MVAHARSIDSASRFSYRDFDTPPFSILHGSAGERDTPDTSASLHTYTTNVHAHARTQTGASRARSFVLFLFLSAARVGAPFLSRPPKSRFRAMRAGARVYTRGAFWVARWPGGGLPPPCSIIATELSVTSGCNRITAACNNNVTRVIMGAPRFGSTSQSSARWAAVRACLMHLLCATVYLLAMEQRETTAVEGIAIVSISFHGAARTKSAKPKNAGIARSARFTRVATAICANNSGI